MNRLPILIALLLASTPALAQTDAPIGLSPADIATIFCTARVADDMAPVTGLLTPELEGAIAEAASKNAEMARETPDEKPPLGDGIPWGAWPDYAPKCVPGAAQLMMDEASIEVQYLFPDTPHAEYTDRLKLRLLDEPVTGKRVWRIDDIAYSGNGNLRTTLVSAFMD